MIIKKTRIKDVFIIEPELREDSRGYFTRIFAKEEFKQQGIKYNIVHVNQSLTFKKGTIRGLHFQKFPKAEDKIIQCLKGSIFDVAVDLRPNSKSFGKWIGEVLSEKNKKMLLIPKGFAHGFQSLENNCVIQYFVSEYYVPTKEFGYSWNDKFFSINWPIRDAILSKKDSALPFYINKI